MRTGYAQIDITPSDPVLMDGMIREHSSEGVHDTLYARALFASNDGPGNGFVIVSVEVCAMDARHTRVIREQAAERTGVPADRIVIATTHTHSGPATYGFFNDVEQGYLVELKSRLVNLIAAAVSDARESVCGFGHGAENSISHYRRLLSRAGHVIMNWEPYEPEDIVRVLGEPDPEVGVVLFADKAHPHKPICVIFTHAGHPNVMSGENYLISSDYPGFAARRIEQTLGCPAMFLNGAQGSVDIDGLKHRDWEGVEHAGGALADAVIAIARNVEFSDSIPLQASSTSYGLPARQITADELEWAQSVLARTGGKVESVADGIGEDFKAALYVELAGLAGKPVQVEQTCIAIGDTALVSVPGELFTEIGQIIKSGSPFARTYPIGLANGYIGYIPTQEAIAQGGYEPDTRRVGDSAEHIILEHSTALLRSLHEEVTSNG